MSASISEPRPASSRAPTWSLDARSPIEQARFNMIEQQIRPWDVLDGEVLQLLGVVRREEFVPPAHRQIAFADLQLPLKADVPEAMRLGQCMLEPKVEARMLQDLTVGKHHRVLEVGAGSGYMAALLGASAESVVSFEIDPELAEMARSNLRRAGIANADVREGDGANVSTGYGLFDIIVLSGSVAEVPKALLSQLKIGGRLGAIVGQLPMMRATIVSRSAEDAWQTVQPWDMVAPRLLGFPEPSRFRF